jgi:hypothetical protein
MVTPLRTNLLRVHWSVRSSRQSTLVDSGIDPIVKLNAAHYFYLEQLVSSQIVYCEDLLGVDEILRFGPRRAQNVNNEWIGLCGEHIQE